MAFDVKFHTEFSAFDFTQWSALKGTESPFLHPMFLSALEDTKCVGGETGWIPHHLGIYENAQLIAAMPGYLKEDSYGEYVFDQSWANAYFHHGLNYYPKWISAVPFTPVPGARLLLRSIDDKSVALRGIELAIKMLASKGVSSAHILFPDDANRMMLSDAKLLQRQSVQFHWHNYDYLKFDDFLNSLTSRKRKSVRKTRRRLHEHGVSITRYHGEEISLSHIAFFYRCYRDTYLKRSGHEGYLTQAFFEQLFFAIKDKMLIVEAQQNDGSIASCLFFYDDASLYGRYWGCLSDIEELHFECCYFQGIEFAISQGLQTFNPGTQGEHKILRGFEPSLCFSLHKLFHPEFNVAVQQFLERESVSINHYFEQAKTMLPFNEHTMNKLICNK